MEMLVVLALTAVLTAAVSLSFRGAARAARADDAAGALASFDRTARDAARRFGRPLELRFDLGRGTVRRAGATAADRVALRLPEGFRVAGLALPGGGAVVATGEVRVPVSARGQTPSYAARIVGPGGGELWLVTAGLTGNTIRVRDASEIEHIFAADVPSPTVTASAAAPPAARADAD